MILGLTGAIGSGKSTALAMFAGLGARTSDADRICHRFYEEKNPALIEPLRQRWGDRIFALDGTVRRQEIGAIVFADPAELEFLNDVIGPLIHDAMIAEIAAVRRSGDLTVLEIPLLFERGYEHRLDGTICVYASPEVRRARLSARGMSAESIDRREKMQWSEERKLEAADYALINRGDPELLAGQCAALLENLKCKSF